MSNDPMTKERFEAIVDNALRGAPLGANREELKIAVYNMAKSFNELEKYMRETARFVTHLTQDEVLAIAKVIASLQTAAGSNASAELHKDAQGAIRSLKPKQVDF